MDDVNTEHTGGSGVAVREGVVTNDKASGRFTGTLDLTDQQRTFVREICGNGGNGMKAAQIAGYNQPSQAAWRLMRNPAIKQAISDHVGTEIAQGSAQAWRVMVELMTDPGVAPQVRFQASKWTLEASGHGLQAALGAARLGLDQGDKPLAERSVKELEEFIERSRQALQGMQEVTRAVSAPVIELTP